MQYASDGVRVLAGVGVRKVVWKKTMKPMEHDSHKTHKTA